MGLRSGRRKADVHRTSCAPNSPLSSRVWTQRQLMVDLFSRHDNSTFKTQLTEGMLRSILVTYPLPCTTISSLRRLISLQHELQISLRCHQRIQQRHLIRRDFLGHSLRSALNNWFWYPGINQSLLRIFLILLCIHQLKIKELFDRTDGRRHILHPAFTVISQIIRSR